ncbi:hypothetical protein MOA67_gp269 [Klebsiella phage KpLz-2_45]|uniref:hypothetical protein n=1 Tax=Klebsiella phage KpLz-2_45 TaxID=2698923 RepID=UPI001F1368A2|nr:hypothetical protein MOA67_gp269 [Klebsiella phage KpLz-2_45]UKS72154.1 hypothetical protein KpLz245_2880 [Klebsiella phage KpLz-2_45]
METEWDHILLTLQLAYSEHKTQTAIKTAARLMATKVKEIDCYNWLMKVTLSPSPLKVLVRELKERRPDDLRYYPGVA